jgi:hypothetical protein
MLWTRVVVPSDITAGRTDDWIATHRHHDRALVRSFRRELSEDASSVIQPEHVTGRPKGISPDVIARAEEITMMNHRLSSVAISQGIGDASELPSMSPTMPERLEEEMRNEGGHISY